MALGMRGLTGTVKYGYQTAARLGAWSFDGTRLESTAIERNEMWLSQAALSLTLDVGRSRWTWHGISVADHGSPFVVIVAGSPEVRHG